MQTRPGDRLIVLASNAFDVPSGATGTVAYVWSDDVKGTTVAVDWDDPAMALRDLALLDRLGDRWTTIGDTDE